MDRKDKRQDLTRLNFGNCVRKDRRDRKDREDREDRKDRKDRKDIEDKRQDLPRLNFGYCVISNVTFLTYFTLGSHVQFITAPVDIQEL